MKRIVTGFVYGAVLAMLLPAGLRANTTPPLLLPPYGGGGLGFEFSDLFEQGDLFSARSKFIWADYQLISTRGKRPDHVKTIVPAVGLNYEHQLWLNLGLRASVSTHWWDEEKPLVRSAEDVFTETFRYQYWTFSLGAAWHFNVGERWDPYLGMLYSVRRASASCDCYSENKTTTSLDLLIGTRYFFGNRFYLLAELGQHGTGYAKLGMGFKIN